MLSKERPAAGLDGPPLRRGLERASERSVEGRTADRRRGALQRPSDAGCPDRSRRPLPGPAPHLLSGQSCRRLLSASRLERRSTTLRPHTAVVDGPPSSSCDNRGAGYLICRRGRVVSGHASQRVIARFRIPPGPFNLRLSLPGAGSTTVAPPVTWLNPLSIALPPALFRRRPSTALPWRASRRAGLRPSLGERPSSRRSPTAVRLAALDTVPQVVAWVRFCVGYAQYFCAV